MNQARLLSFSLACLLTTSCMAHDQPSEIDLQALAEKSYRDAVEYVSTLPDDCAYTDGYACHEASPATSRTQAVPATLLVAWPAAHRAFSELNELTDEQKQLKHYHVRFSADENQIEVLFRPLLLPQLIDGKVQGKMRATIGKEVRISVNNSDLQVVKVLFGK